MAASVGTIHMSIGVVSGKPEIGARVQSQNALDSNGP